MKTKDPTGQVREIILLGHPTLYKMAKPVTDPTSPATQQIVSDLHATCVRFKGMGIAAPQIDVSLRIIIVASKPNERYPNAPLMEPTAMINPRILTRFSAAMNTGFEGCLSIPGLYGRVRRFTKVRVEYTDINGKLTQGTFSGFIARVIQHEIDHLDGILFLHYVDLEDLLSEKEYHRLMAAKKEAVGTKK